MGVGAARNKYLTIKLIPETNNTEAVKDCVLQFEAQFTPEVWCAITGIEVHDPDGWRADKRDWELPVTRADFIDRCAESTCWYPPEFFNEFKFKVTVEHHGSQLMFQSWFGEGFKNYQVHAAKQ